MLKLDHFCPGHNYTDPLSDIRKKLKQYIGSNKLTKHTVAGKQQNPIEMASDDVVRIPKNILRAGRGKPNISVGLNWEGISTPNNNKKKKKKKKKKVDVDASVLVFGEKKEVLREVFFHKKEWNVTDDNGLALNLIKHHGDNRTGIDNDLEKKEMLLN